MSDGVIAPKAKGVLDIEAVRTLGEQLCGLAST